MMTAIKPQAHGISAYDKFESLKIINGTFMRYVNASEFMVLHFIWQRTIFWGKSEEYIGAKHFLEGVPEAQLEGISLSWRSLTRCLATLEEKQIIIRSLTNSGGSKYMINFAWNVDMLKTPKSKDKLTNNNRLKTPKDKVAKLANGGSQIGEYISMRINKYTNTDNSEGKPSQTVQGSVEALLQSTERAKSKSLASRKKKIERAMRTERVPDLEYLWVAMMREAFPDYAVPAWTVKERGQMRNFAKAYRDQNNDAPVKPFLQFVIDNWHRIGKLRLSWKKDINYPDYPNLGFMIGFKKEFLAAYADKEFNTRQVAMTNTEREISKLVKLGFTRAQAEDEIRIRAENSKVALKSREKADQAEIANRALLRENERLKREAAQKDLQRGRELMKEKKLNRGSKPLKVTKKLDADGYGEFEGV